MKNKACHFPTKDNRPLKWWADVIVDSHIETQHWPSTSQLILKLLSFSKCVQTGWVDLETMGLFWCHGFQSCHCPSSSPATACAHSALSYSDQSGAAEECVQCYLLPKWRLLHGNASYSFNFHSLYLEEQKVTLEKIMTLLFIAIYFSFFFSCHFNV